MTMALPLVGAIVALLVWIVVTFLYPLGPAATVLHLLLGAAGVLFVRWWALRQPGR
ncbi:MAG: hypothetical protein IPI38_05695 [Gemmatimonadetes bacterium]|nr:hypothetical protein [Gemmatimonadota bacterium]MBP6670276.1 hypothetical protein [Gemmatimonadales bacterium]MBK6778361.1 hypothetical protein [Gemmatimonadota bacterium]MBK7349329.1 hypothetical protein [Gemmatimonadota bacterium]MBK7714898.1 hypothetical protein [Gemmatimonadota bacterium]